MRSALATTPRHDAAAAWLSSGFDDGVREGPSRVAELAALAAFVAAEEIFRNRQRRRAALRMRTSIGYEMISPSIQLVA